MHNLGGYLLARGLTINAAGQVWFSEPEIRLCQALVERGFAFKQQVRITRGSTTAVLDFLVEDDLAVEVDGKEFHDPAEDQQRDWDVHTEHGIWTLRVPGWRVMRDPEAVVCRVALELSKMNTFYATSTHK